MMSSTSGSTVYRFRNNFHFSVFLVTPEGVIATDPIHADTPRDRTILSRARPAVFRLRRGSGIDRAAKRDRSERMPPAALKGKSRQVRLYAIDRDEPDESDDRRQRTQKHA